MPADRQSFDLYQLIGDELNAARIPVKLATLWYEEGRVDALLDEGKTVEAGAVLGQVDEMIEELDPPPEWLLHQIEEQAARLVAVTQQGMG